MKVLIISSALTCVLLPGCVSTKKQIISEYTGKSYGQLFVIANTADLEVRVRLEKEFANVADTNGYKLVKCMDVIPPAVSDPVPPAKETLLEQAKKSGCDAFFIVYFMKNGATTKYVPGEKYKGSETWLGGLAMQIIVGRNRIVKDEIPDKYKKDVYIPGVYTKEKGFYLLSVLYDVATEEVVYTDQSAPFNEPELVAFSHGYLSELLKRLQREKILKK